MKITFIRPNIGERPSLDAITPLVFAYLSAMTPIDVDRVLYDDRIGNVPKVVEIKKGVLHNDLT